MSSNGWFGRLDDLRAEEITRWRDLSGADTAFASPFFQYGFALAVQKARGGVKVWIDRGDTKEVQEILAVQQRNFGMSILGGLTGWERLGGDLSDYFAPVGTHKLATNINTVLEKTPIDYLPYSHYPAPLHNYPTEAHYTIATRIVLEDGSGAYLEWLAAHNPKYLSDARRRWRKLEREHGKVEFVWHDTDPELVTAVIEAKRAQYARTGARDSLAAPWARKLLRTLAHANDEKDCTVVLSSLRCNGEWVALHFGLRAHGTLQLWFPVYRPEFKNYAPGRLLLLQMIEQASANGVKLIDRGDGCSEEKLQTANSMHLMKKHHYQRRNVTGLLSHTVDALKWRVEKRLVLMRKNCTLTSDGDKNA